MRTDDSRRYLCPDLSLDKTQAQARLMIEVTGGLSARGTKPTLFGDMVLAPPGAPA